MRAVDAELLRREEARLEALALLLERADAGREPAALADVGVGVLPIGVDWVAVVAPSGELLASRWVTRPAVASGSAAGELGQVAAVAAARRGLRDAAGERHGGLAALDGAPALAAAAPVRRGDQVVAALVVGTDLGATVVELKGSLLVDLAVYGPDGSPLATTLPGGAAALPRLVAPPAEEELHPAELRLGERPFRALVAPLRARGTTVGALAPALPADAVDRVGAETRSQMALLFGGAMVGAVIVGWLVARLIAAPVLRLAEAARAVGAGDLARRSGVRGPDEIGELGATFDRMAEDLGLRLRQLTEANVNTMRALAAAVDAKDPYTHGHSQRVATYGVLVARRLGLDEPFLAEMEMGGLLHDVGKIGVPDAVLTKPGRLDDEEWAHIRKHPTMGFEILRPVGFSPTVMDVVLYHHERLNGRGFPAGLRGDAIPLAARIAAVCDAYDAMTSDRSYRRSLGHEGAVAELRRGIGEQFDGACVEALIAGLDESGLAAVAVPPIVESAAE